MKHQILLLLSIFAFIYKSEAICNPVWTFECHEHGNWTYIRHVKSDDFPISSNSTITKLQITDTDSLFSLRKDLCQYLPKLEVLWVRQVGLKQTTETALAKCDHLKVVKICKNNIGDGFDRNTFKNNVALEAIWLQRNKITSLKEGTFNHLKNLAVLHLGGNNLQHFSASLVEGLEKLQLLAIYSNNIVELDSAALLHSLPSLIFFSFNDNPLKCTDMKKILSPIESKNVLAPIHADLNIERDYKVGSYEGFSCLVEDAVAMEEDAHYRNSAKKANTTTDRHEAHPITGSGCKITPVMTIFAVLSTITRVF